MNKKGIAGLEVGLFLALVGGAIFFLHVKLMEVRNRELESITPRRYSGELQWKP